MGGCKMDSINYSIIIPHKNSPDLLRRCLKSIPRRNDLQIIIVDDNSDDKIVDLSNFPGYGEECVEIVYTKDGKGAGYARNQGLEVVKGKWILFVDADDFLLGDIFEKLDSYLYSDEDIIYFHLSDKNNILEVPPSYQDVIDYNRGEHYNKVLTHPASDIPYLHNVPVGKMIKYEIIRENKIMFDEIRYANDVMFFTKLAYCIKSVAISNKYLYCISKPTHNNLTSKKDFNSAKNRIDVSLRRNSFVKKHGYGYLMDPPLMMIWQYRSLKIKHIIYLLLMVYKSDSSIFWGLSKFVKHGLSKFIKIR